ncbi:MAG: arsenate reductase ArsC [Deltaproteobacteria bacterium]|nr:arsenate reductase ArsC [Deltaproteobacteria bacterium]
MSKYNVLFLCTGNSCRSQMAEGWARHLKGEQITAYSAGFEPSALNPLAVQVMAEVGVDISRHSSKHVAELTGITFDYVVTVCGHANEHCPVFPSPTRVLHAGFEDPPQLAAALAAQGASAEAQLDCYRRIRDEIRAFVATLPEAFDSRPRKGLLTRLLEKFDKSLETKAKAGPCCGGGRKGGASCC